MPSENPTQSQSATAEHRDRADQMPRAVFPDFSAFEMEVTCRGTTFREHGSGRGYAQQIGAAAWPDLVVPPEHP